MNIGEVLKRQDQRWISPQSPWVWAPEDSQYVKSSKSRNYMSSFSLIIHFSVHADLCCATCILGEGSCVIQKLNVSVILCNLLRLGRVKTLNSIIAGLEEKRSKGSAVIQACPSQKESTIRICYFIACWLWCDLSNPVAFAVQDTTENQHY